ncbi:hypothetical protein SDC9_201856 [bioreactor metagenome]|uniref:Uncharacterized protein n=1 Tax=bioreactor metagenome TaxID=1076179 RepID=A0A645ISI1_9ZZZZ
MAFSIQGFQSVKKLFTVFKGDDSCLLGEYVEIIGRFDLVHHVNKRFVPQTVTTADACHAESFGKCS